MTTLKNPRHERFAQELAKGKSAIAAHKLAGYRPDRGTASKLQHDANISQRVRELLDEGGRMARVATERATEVLAIDREWVLAKLKENVERAMQAVPVMRAGKETGEFVYDGSVANRALELLGKEIGMFIERSEVRTGKIDALPADARDRFIDAIDRELARREGGLPPGPAAGSH